MSSFAPTPQEIKKDPRTFAILTQVPGYFKGTVKAEVWSHPHWILGLVVLWPNFFEDGLPIDSPLSITQPLSLCLRKKLSILQDLNRFAEKYGSGNAALKAGMQLPTPATNTICKLHDHSLLSA